MQYFYVNLLKGAGIVLFLFLLWIIAREDIKTKRIPHKYLTFLLLAGLPVSRLMLHISIQGQVRGAFTVSTIMLFCSIIKQKGFGGGDVKLMFVSGFIIGEKYNIWAFVLGILCAGAYSVSKLVLDKKRSTENIAFGPFLCAGILASVFCGDYLSVWFWSS